MHSYVIQIGHNGSSHLCVSDESKSDASYLDLIIHANASQQTWWPSKTFCLVINTIDMYLSRIMNFTINTTVDDKPFLTFIPQSLYTLLIAIIFFTNDFIRRPSWFIYSFFLTPNPLFLAYALQKLHALPSDANSCPTKIISLPDLSPCKLIFYKNKFTFI